MRTIPVGLVMQDNVETTAKRVAAFTHYDRDAGDCCAVISKAAAGLAAGKTKAEVLADIPAKYLSGELIPSIDPVETTRCALACFHDGSGYTDVIRRACVLGGDTDTIACIAGGLAGILWGVPQKWIDTLLLKDRITQVAEQLRNKAAERSSAEKNEESGRNGTHLNELEVLHTLRTFSVGTENLQNHISAIIRQTVRMTKCIPFTEDIVANRRICYSCPACRLTRRNHRRDNRLGNFHGLCPAFMNDAVMFRFPDRDNTVPFSLMEFRIVADLCYLT